jgi:hypothetical protein
MADVDLIAEQEELIQKAVFGKQVESFFNSDIGKYIIALSELDRSEALTLLAKCDPENANTVRELQNRVVVCDKIRGWLENAIINGVQALNIIDERSE